MKFYHTTTEYACGVDLHSRQMYICVMDREGKKLVHRNIKGNDFGHFLKLVEPYRDDLTVVCENIHDPHNVSAIMRTCDAVGVQLVHLLYWIEAFPKIGKLSSASATPSESLSLGAELPPQPARARIRDRISE